MGYDFDSGRQDISAHPFSSHFSPEDARVTTRIDEKNLSDMIWSCIHEGGHALYEQGILTDNYGTPLGNTISYQHKNKFKIPSPQKDNIKQYQVVYLLLN